LKQGDGDWNWLILRGLDEESSLKLGVKDSDPKPPLGRITEEVCAGLLPKGGGAVVHKVRQGSG